MKDYVIFRKQRLDKIKYLREDEGKTQNEIAEIIGLSLRMVQYICRQNGFKKNSESARQELIKPKEDYCTVHKVFDRKRWSSCKNIDN